MAYKFHDNRAWFVTMWFQFVGISMSLELALTFDTPTNFNTTSF